MTGNNTTKPSHCVIEKYLINKKAKFKVWGLVAAIVCGIADGLLSCAKIGKLLGFTISFMLEFISSIAGGDKVFEALICAFIVAIISMCLSNGLSASKITKYNKQLLSHLRKKKWAIIKKAIRTFFKHIKTHLVRYFPSSFFISMFGVTAHSVSKGVIKQAAAKY